MIKIAFMFLTYDDINRSDIWKIFFNNVDHSKYNIYIHNKDPVNDPYFKKCIIGERINTIYGDISLVNATLLLLKNALKDPDNKFFVLLSNSCIPLYDFNTIYNYIIDRNTSLISCIKPTYDQKIIGKFTNSDISRYLALTDKNFISKNNFMKQHQWMVLDRKLADYFTKHNYTKLFEKMSVPDEHYFINIAVKFKLPFKDEVITFIDRKNKSSTKYRPYPKTFEIITEKIIEEARKNGHLFFRKVANNCHIYDNFFKEIITNKEPIAKN